MLEQFNTWKSGLWQRFVELAKGPHALFWLAVCALTDPIFFPIAPEIYLVALILAHRPRFKLYLSISIIFSTLGAVLGYFVGVFLFQQFGMPLLHFYHLGRGFDDAKTFLEGGVFIGMILVAFQLIPEKVFVLAAGFLGLSIWPFLAGFFIGRALRLSILGYLTHRYGDNVLSVLKKYFLVITVLMVMFLLYYGIVHGHFWAWHHWPRPLPHRA
jgi:membrane protein YqaA with SNARE-associated domain